ncbi:MAG TPA: 5-(carboxyamino)imidazole ribonucleotide synthase, partial [Coleofasciculaceae cyanobacterium]
MIDFTLSASTPINSVGIIGGGQLAWMMADAAKKLGVELHIQTPSKSDPAVAIATDTVLAPIADATATKELATRSQVITFENEFIDLPALSHLAEQGTCFRPSLQALRPILDKCEQRTYLRQLGLPTPHFVPLDPDQPQLDKLGFPVVVKTRRHGYDGQGTFICQAQQSLEQVLQSRRGVPLLLEEFVPFTQELAMVAARSVDGAVRCYPLVETQQTDQVCRRVFAPAAVSPTVMQQAEAIAHTLLTGLGTVGVFGIELFLTAEGTLLVNELAPRVHNSGHFTLDACRTSQFEQHLR